VQEVRVGFEVGVDPGWLKKISRKRKERKVVKK
jgi:hypothetical protein